VPFLHQRKSVERFTPTSRTTSLVDSRTSMPAKRSKTGGLFGASTVGVPRSRTGGMTSVNDNCTGRSACGLFEPVGPATCCSDARGCIEGLIGNFPVPLRDRGAPVDIIDVLI